MLGSRLIGGEHLGSGRSLIIPPVEASASVTGSATVTADGIPVRTGTASVTAEATVTLSGGLVKRGVRASITASATATLAPSLAARSSASVSGLATVAASASVNRAATAGVTGRSVATANGAVLRPAAASVQADATILVTGRRLRVSSGAISGAATVSGDASRAAKGSASITGVATATARGTFPAKVGRVTIEVLERVKAIAVQEKVKSIVFTGDDEEIFVEEFEKQPSEIIDYDLDMRKFFRKIRTDGIDTIAVTVTPTGDPDDLESGPGGFDPFELVGDAPNHRAILWIGGGRDGVEYKVTATVTTVVGRVEEVDFLILVEDE